jgi:hypothetical protein
MKRSAQRARTAPDKSLGKIRHGITHTREQLADTVTMLAHRVRVPAPVKGTVRGTKDTVLAKAEQVKQHLGQGSETVQDKAGEATRQANKVIHQARTKPPAPVVGRIKHLRGTVRHRPVPAVAVVLGVVLLLPWLLCNNR